MPGGEPLLRVPTGTTRVAAVIGNPVRHSLSPVLHNAAFRELGLDWVYVAFEVKGGNGAGALNAMRSLGLGGLSVTMPFKGEVAAAVGSLSAVAKRLGSVNTVHWTARPGDSDLAGDSTDGPGFVDALRLDEGFDPAGRHAVVLGAGGAARAVSLSLAEAGAASVTVVARRRAAAAACASLAGGSGLDPSDMESFSAVVSAADLLVNATPVGMSPGDGLPLGLTADRLPAGGLVADLVYHPAVTPLVAAARSRGITACNGLDMLLRQAARQVELWTGRQAPIDAMSAAVMTELRRR